MIMASVCAHLDKTADDAADGWNGAGILGETGATVGCIGCNCDRLASGFGGMSS